MCTTDDITPLVEELVRNIKFTSITNGDRKLVLQTLRKYKLRELFDQKMTRQFTHTTNWSSYWDTIPKYPYLCYFKLFWLLPEEIRKTFEARICDAIVNEKEECNCCDLEEKFASLPEEFKAPINPPDTMEKRELMH